MNRWPVNAGAAAAILGVSHQYFRNLVLEGLVPVAYVLGKRKFFWYEDLEKIASMIEEAHRKKRSQALRALGPTDERAGRQGGPAGEAQPASPSRPPTVSERARARARSAPKASKRPRKAQRPRR
jgi:hypothetical protein